MSEEKSVSAGSLFHKLNAPELQQKTVIISLYLSVLFFKIYEKFLTSNAYFKF